MSRPYSIPVWKTAPFVRLVIPVMAGIMIQWYLQIALHFIIICAASCCSSIVLFSFLPIALRYQWRLLQGLLITGLLILSGLYITWQKDIRHANNWYGKCYNDSCYLVVSINEPLVEKAKSFKASCIVESIVCDDNVIACKGNLLVYFDKDTSAVSLRYGDIILINKSIQPIKNSGNPGAFDYKRYAAFQQIFHQVYLKKTNWIKLDNTAVNQFNRFIFGTRAGILAILRKNMGADKDALGIAEALLIGYTNDLDKDLVQAYSNTGVVHIIAISGMHLALIYLLLEWIMSRLPFIKRSKHLKLLLILSCLWLFALLTGGAASVLRSAVMFTCIALGKNYFRATAIYNSLAASAFVLLCYNPYFLWDVGFQLSYLAVVGIVAFQKPLYNLVFIKNKWVDKVWQLMAVSLAAQVLTFPICIYYFHQFPVLFLIANIIAVPLSGIILYAEIGLLAFSWVPFLGIWLGKLVGWMVWLMNEMIIRINTLSFSVWDNIHATGLTTIILYAVVVALSKWLINKNKKWFQLALCGTLAFTMLQAYAKWASGKQQKLVVYNVPQHLAIDLVKGNTYCFIGDSILLQDGVLQNFHLKPGRIAMQLNKRMEPTDGFFKQGPFYQCQNKRILFYDGSLNFEPNIQKINVDIIIISHNPKLYIAQLERAFNCSQYVFDASNSLWKIGKWQADCSALHLQSYSVPENGAFLLDL